MGDRIYTYLYLLCLKENSLNCPEKGDAANDAGNGVNNSYFVPRFIIKPFTY